MNAATIPPLFLHRDAERVPFLRDPPLGASCATPPKGTIEGVIPSASKPEGDLLLSRPVPRARVRAGTRPPVCARVCACVCA